MTSDKPASLAELQRSFAARSMSSELSAEQLAFRPADGMQIYANMFIWRQIDSLVEDFPKLAALTGDSFAPLCQAYVAAYPSQHHSLARLGRALPDYLAACTGLRADLSDMAALEWARCEVFEEASARTLATLQAEDLRVVPALRTLRLDYDVVTVWNDIEHARSIPEPRREPSCTVVWRKDFDVYHVRLDALEAEAFGRLQAGATLAEICEVFAEQSDAIGAASRAIGSWLAEGWIAQGATE